MGSPAKYDRRATPRKRKPKAEPKPERQPEPSTLESITVAQLQAIRANGVVGSSESGEWLHTMTKGQYDRLRANDSDPESVMFRKLRATANTKW